MFVDIQAKLHGRVETQLQVADMQRVDKEKFLKMGSASSFKWYKHLNRSETQDIRIM